MTDPYTYHAETPSKADYLRLRVVSGLTPKTAEGAASGLPNTLFAVVVRDGEQVVVDPPQGVGLLLPHPDADRGRTHEVGDQDRRRLGRARSHRPSPSTGRRGYGTPALSSGCG